jgi:hypothetical protein
MYPKRFDRLAIKIGKLQIVAKQCEIIGSKTCQFSPIWYAIRKNGSMEGYKPGSNEDFEKTIRNGMGNVLV